MDCAPGTRIRPVKPPGPRCASHLRAFKKQASERSWGARIEKTYGITADEYYSILEAQGGKCAICQRATGKTKRLSVDHDHVTGEVRSLVCSVCNNILGHFRDDPDVAYRVYLYLCEPPGREVLTLGRVRDSGMYSDQKVRDLGLVPDSLPSLLEDGDDGANTENPED